MHKYPTNLTDKQWQVIKNMLDPKERFRKYSLRSVFDGILYIVDYITLNVPPVAFSNVPLQTWSHSVRQS